MRTKDGPFMSQAELSDYDFEQNKIRKARWNDKTNSITNSDGNKRLEDFEI